MMSEPSLTLSIYSLRQGSTFTDAVCMSCIDSIGSKFIVIFRPRMGL